MHVDTFSTTLSDLKTKDARDPLVVFDHIASSGRFSCFEIEGPLCRTVSFLFEKEFIEQDHSVGYPWASCSPTPRGIAWRMDALCEACEGKAQVIEKIGRHRFLKRCLACDGQGFVMMEMAS